MEIYNKLEQNKNVALALGFFDGVHLAHQKLIETTVELAKKSGEKSAVLTFLDSPYSIIKKVRPKYITTFKKKAELIAAMGVDLFFAIDFNMVQKIEANKYIEEILINYFAPKYVVTGFNHTFGRDKEGGSELLMRQKAFKHVMIAPVTSHGMLVSSTNIRKFIEDGDFYSVKKLLNRFFSYKGTVVKGAQIARQLGRKTANVIWGNNIVKPPYGVYFGGVTIKNDRYDVIDCNGGGENKDEEKFPALINFGVRPTIDEGRKETLEAHLIGFEGDLYDKTIEVEFYKKMRDEKKFNSTEELRQKIEADYAEALLISKFYF